MRTKDFKTALYRKRLLDLMTKEEFVFRFKDGDYELIFEYDTTEELKEILALTKEKKEEINHKKRELERVEDMIERVDRNIGYDERGIRFIELEVKFIKSKRKTNKVGESTYKAYESTFKKLHEFFKKRYVNSLTIEDIEDFREFLKTKYNLKNKTINNHITYVNKFLKFAKTWKLIDYNPAEGLEELKEEKVNKVNFTDEEINKILDSDLEEPYKNFIMIAIYSGMRLHEIHNLTNNSIKHEPANDIYYFDIEKSKTNAGIRQVPIHNEILDTVKKIDFPIFKNKTVNAVQKAVNKELKKVINEKHTFRAKFIENALNKNPQLLYAIQEVVGHSKPKKNK